MSRTIKELLSEQALIACLTEELNQAMDDELAKPENEIDFDYLDDLADALLLLGNSRNEDFTLTAATVRKFRTKYRLSMLRKALGSTAAMAAVVFLCYTAMTAKEPQPVPVEPTATVAATTTAPADKTTAPPTTTVTTEALTETLTETTTDSRQETTAVTETTAATATTAAEEGYRPVQGADAPDSDDEREDGSPDEDSDYEYGGVAGESGIMGGGMQMHLGFTDAFQKTYVIGEAFNPSGIVVTIGGDSRSRVVELSACSVSGFSSDTAGTKTVTVRYQNYQASFTVEVMKP